MRGANGEGDGDVKGTGYLPYSFPASRQPSFTLVHGHRPSFVLFVVVQPLRWRSPSLTFVCGAGLLAGRRLCLHLLAFTRAGRPSSVLAHLALVRTSPPLVRTHLHTRLPSFVLNLTGLRPCSLTRLAPVHTSLRSYSPSAVCTHFPSFGPTYLIALVRARLYSIWPVWTCLRSFTLVWACVGWGLPSFALTGPLTQCNLLVSSSLVTY